MSAAQYADPMVSRRKFDREIAEFRSLAVEHLARGWMLAHAEFPSAVVVMAAPKTSPTALIMAVKFDFSNYDAAPPSVQLVRPLTLEPYTLGQLPTRLPRTLPAVQVEVPGAPGPVSMQQTQDFMQGYGEDQLPFLCLAGVREYHAHPAHSGDAWELHRASGAGRLVRLLEVISRYGTDPIAGYTVQLRHHISLNVGQAPE